MRRTGATRLTHDSGQGLVEYALILALASLAIMSVLLIFRNSIGNTMQGASNRLDASASPGGYESGGGFLAPTTPSGDPGAVSGDQEGGGGGGGYGKGTRKGSGRNGNGWDKARSNGN